MKKVLIGAIAIFVALAAWFWYAKNRTKTSGSAQQPLPPATKPDAQPTNAGLFDPQQGAAKIAIDRRVSEIKENRNAFLSAISAVPRATALNGVNNLRDVFVENIGQSTGQTGLGGLPIGNLTPDQARAISGLSDLEWFGSSYWDNYKKIATALKDVQGLTNVRLFSLPTYAAFSKSPPDLNQIRAETVGVIDPSAVTSKSVTNYKVDNVVKSTINQTVNFAKNWLALNTQAENAVKEAAINQLRDSGWRFVGYDAPA
jgi:hypothetical protein